MIVIILAAGKGTRLGKPFPKTLTNLKDGKSILLHQLDGLYRYIRREDIFVVVGYKKELIKQVFPDLHYINNEKYNETNTSQSLLIALNQFSKKDILWLNGDIVYDHRIIKRLISAPNSTFAIATTIRVNPKMAESFFSNPMICLVLNSPLLLSMD